MLKYRLPFYLSTAFMLFFVGPFSAIAENTAPDRPNVLFIAVDDLNDWTGCLGGHPQALTPNLDALAARGVLFNNAHCAAPACNPSRAALMTGIRPTTSGVYTNPQPWRMSPALADAVTLPQHFRASGYRAIGSGKIYHGAFADPDSWNEYWPSLTQQSPSDPMPENRPLNGHPRPSHFDWGPIPNPTEEMGDSQVADWVISQLGQEHDQPLFLACGFFRPHLPWYAPEDFFEPFPLDEIVLPDVNENDLDDIPQAGRNMAKPTGDHKFVTDSGEWKKAVQGYLASIYFMDSQLGRVMTALDAREDSEEWVIVLWSDHGWHLGEKLHWRKFALWEEATHNVMLWVAPGESASGGVCSEPASLMDVYPTLIDLCDLPGNTAIEGSSLLPQIQDPETPRDFPAMTTHGRGNHSLRTTRWRYIRYANGSEELYDRDADPMEWTNLAGDSEYADILREMAEFLPEKEAVSIPQRR